MFTTHRKNAAAIILSLLFVIMIFSGCGGGSSEEPSAVPETAETTTEEEAPRLTGMDILEVAPYSGVYYEDGSDTPCSGVLSVKIRNTSDTTLEYAVLSGTYEGAEVSFSVSALPAHGTCIVAEKSQRAYGSGGDIDDIKAEVAAFAESDYDAHSELLSYSASGGQLTVTNISDSDIAGPVRVVYKNFDGVDLVGGIAYSVTADNGIKAGASVSLDAPHFNEENCRLVYTLLD